MSVSAAVRLSVALAILAVPAEALGADTVRTSSVTGRLVVPDGGSTIRLHCPPSAVALNGAVTRRGAGVVVQRSTPGPGPASWSFRVAPSGSGSRSVSAVLRCVRLEMPAGLTARLDVRTRMRPRIAVAPGATETVRLGCGRAWSATGYGLTGDPGDTVRLAAAVPDAHGWRFALENTGTAPARAGVSARCLRTHVDAAGGGSAQLRFAVGRPSSPVVFASGPSERATTRRCGAGRFSLAAGFSIDPGSSLGLVTATPTGARGLRWTFRDVEAGDRYRAHLVCLRKGSRFR